MSPAEQPARWTLRDRKTRMLLYLVVLLGIALWRFAPRPWHPTVTLRTAHHLIESTATRQQTEETAQALDLLYGAYSNRFGGLARFQPRHPELKVKLFKDRAEFRWVNPGLGWAEAFYRKPYCRAYFSAQEVNPYHWMLHEATHQLNAEVAHFELEKWIEEGVADYFSCSVLASNELAVGRIDPNTYPVWWIDELATSPDLTENLRNGSVIPLRAIITNRGGPSLNSHFNLYYLHWWTLAHYLFESPGLRERMPALVERGGGLQAFEELIGPIDAVQTDWHTYVRGLKRTLAGNDLDARRVGRLRPVTPSVSTP